MKSKSLVLFFVIFTSGCSNKVDDDYVWKPLEVTVTAYNSLSSQTDSSPNLAAWGDTLKPGMKCIAVSRDLITLGITHNTMIKIDTFPGVYLVKDKMNRRWRNRIDIYMGEDRQKAKQWGRKKLVIRYAVKKDSTTTETDTP
ncbi:MAG: hypothetical protein AAFZ89_13250 [Bacteroidota bacterium]